MPVLVVLSAEAAFEVMKTHDIALSNRPKITFFKKFLYDCKDVALAPNGEYWRRIKSICVLNLLSSKKARSFRTVREEEAKSMINNIMKQSTSTTSSVFNLSDIFRTLTNDVIFRVTLGTKYNDGDQDGNMFKGLALELNVLENISI
ncbi:hypothetical protein ACFX2A_045436 [Malus domestica]